MLNLWFKPARTTDTFSSESDRALTRRPGVVRVTGNANGSIGGQAIEPRY
jgi:hypothetical protein